MGRRGRDGEEREEGEYDDKDSSVNTSSTTPCHIGLMCPVNHYNGYMPHILTVDQEKSYDPPCTGTNDPIKYLRYLAACGPLYFTKYFNLDQPPDSAPIQRQDAPTRLT